MRAMRGVTWNYVGTVGRIAATFISQVVLARLLGPEQFGTFGYAFLTVSLVALVVELGLQQALVQAEKLGDDAVAIAAGRLLLTGAGAGALIFVFAPQIAELVFSAPQASDVIRWMGPSLVITTAMVSANASLSREIEFKVIQLAGLSAYVLAYVLIGVTCALLGLGMWSLVIAWYTYSLVFCVAMYWFAPRRLWPGNPFARLSVQRFGFVIMSTNLVNWSIDNVAQMAIGRSFGAGFLGQFSVANNLVKVPADHLVRSLQIVLFPLAARAQKNDAGLRRAYLTLLTGVGLVAFPTFTFVAVMSEPIVSTLLGAKWLFSAQLLTPLAIAMLFHSGEALCGPILGGRGEPRIELRLKSMTLLFMLAVLAVTMTISVVAVAWGVVVVYLFRWARMNGALMHRLQIGWAALMRSIMGPALLACLAGVVSVGIELLAQAYWAGVADYWVLAAAVVAVTALSVLSVVLAPSVVLGPSLISLLSQMMQTHPRMARVPGMRRIAALATAG
jgi:O-antigen/teichoic acid export membrane protein